MDAPAIISHSTFEITDNESEELRQAFNLFDKDGAGTISSEEVRVALTVLGFDISSDELNEIINKFDSGKMGQISFDEFSQILLYKISELQPRSQLVRAFDSLDLDHDGTISLQDLEGMNDFLGEGLSRDELREIIMNARGLSNKFDIHTKDVGSITLNEFISTVKKNYS